MERVHGDGVQHAAGELLTCPFCLAVWGRDRTHRRFRIRAGTHQTGVHRADGVRRVRHPATGLRQRETGRRGRASRPRLGAAGCAHCRGLGLGLTDQAQRQRPGLVQRWLQVVQQNPSRNAHGPHIGPIQRRHAGLPLVALRGPRPAELGRTRGPHCVVNCAHSYLCTPNPQGHTWFPRCVSPAEAGRMEDHRISRRPDVRRYRRPATSRSPYRTTSWAGSTAG